MHYCPAALHGARLVAFPTRPGRLQRNRLPWARLYSCSTRLFGSRTHRGRLRREDVWLTAAHNSLPHIACIHARPPAPSEPGPGGTSFFSAPSEPGRRTRFASGGPGWRAGSGIQSCDHQTPSPAWWRVERSAHWCTLPA
jgi:hypothetical protein